MSTLTGGARYFRLSNAARGRRKGSAGREPKPASGRLVLSLLEDTLMRSRSVRPNIYLPVVRFGVVVADWKYILGATLVGYLVPFFFRLKMGSVPLWFVTGVGAAALSYGFFRYTKVGRRSYWFQHSIRALYEGSVARRTVPGDRKRAARAWLMDRSHRQH